MKISVITINYNDSNGLRKTIESVLSQDHSHVEFIVIDGGSTDGSRKVIEEYKDHIDFWVSEKDGGIYNAMNKGIMKITGEYCNFMNSGDTFFNKDVIEQICTLSDGSDIICGTAVMEDREKKAPESISMGYLFSGSLCHQSAFIKSSIMRKHMYDESLKIVADRKFFLQALILDNCSYQAVDIPIVNYDINGFSAQNPVASRLEYSRVLEELVPARIRTDYAHINGVTLYGDDLYSKLFEEIGRRKYKLIIYRITVITLRIISIFKKSASFIHLYPKSL